MLEEFKCGINKGMIFRFNVEVSHNSLFLASPRVQRIIEKKIITSS